MLVIYFRRQMSFSNLPQFSQKFPIINLPIELQASLLKGKELDRGLLAQKTNRDEFDVNSDQEDKEKTQSHLNNGRWNNTEHRSFIEGIFKYSNDWKRITEDVKTRNSPQARSHSQKFFSKLNKYITKNNANYYVDLKKIFLFGKQVDSKTKENVIEMLFLAHDHLDNVLNCELLNHNLLRDFLGNVKKNKPPKEENMKNNLSKNKNINDNFVNYEVENQTDKINNNKCLNYNNHQSYNYDLNNSNKQTGKNTNKIYKNSYTNDNQDCSNFSGGKVYNNINININVTNIGSAYDNNKKAYTITQQSEMNQNYNNCNFKNFDFRNNFETEKNRNFISNELLRNTNKEIYGEALIKPQNNRNLNMDYNNQYQNTKQIYEQACVNNINNLNLSTLKDNSTEEVKTRSSNRKEKGKIEERIPINENLTQDFIGKNTIIFYQKFIIFHHSLL